MNINTDDIYWHYFSISELLREYKLYPDISVKNLFETVPFGIVKKSLILGNSTPICDWVMEYFGFEYDNEKDGWIKK